MGYSLPPDADTERSLHGLGCPGDADTGSVLVPGQFDESGEAKVGRVRFGSSFDGSSDVHGGYGLGPRVVGPQGFSGAPNSDLAPAPPSPPAPAEMAGAGGNAGLSSRGDRSASRCAAPAGFWPGSVP